MPAALWALAIGAFGVGMTEFVIGGVLPLIAADFGVTISQAGNMATAYALGVLAGAPLVAILGARAPRKTLLAALGCVYTLGNLITAVAPDLGVALLGRVVTALNHGAFFGVGSIIAASLVARERQAGAIAFMFTGLTVANLAGVPFATWLAQVLGWRAVFWADVGIGVVMVAAILALVPRMPGGGATSVRREMRAFLDRRVLTAMGVTVLGPAAFFTVITYIAPMATRTAGYSEGGVAVLMALFGLGLVLGNWLGGRYADWNLRLTLFVTLAGQAVALLAFWLLAHSAVATAVCVFVMAAFGFATVSPIQKMVMERAQAAGAATLAASVNIGMFNLGNALGAWLGGATIAHGFGLTSPILDGALLSLAALALAACDGGARRGGGTGNV